METPACRTRARLHHFRSHAGADVDFVSEDAAGRCVGIEAKAAATVASADSAGPRRLAELRGARRVRGVVLHQGTQSLPSGPGLHAPSMRAPWAAARSALSRARRAPS